LDENQKQDLKRLVERLPLVINELEFRSAGLLHAVEQILKGDDWGKINPTNLKQRSRDRDDDRISIRSFDSFASE
jgi:hypothetical protein